MTTTKHPAAVATSASVSVCTVVGDGGNEAPAPPAPATIPTLSPPTCSQPSHQNHWSSLTATYTLDSAIPPLETPLATIVFAQRTHDALPVVLKTPRYASHYTRELHHVLKISSPYVVRVLEAWRGTLVLPRLEPLHPTLPKDLSEICRWMRDVTRGLAAVHAAHVAHRDVTPGNLMKDPESGRAVLIDFGLAASVKDGAAVEMSARGEEEGVVVGEEDEDEDEDEEEDKVVECCGTAGYLAPELSSAVLTDGKKLGSTRQWWQRADMYSLGAIFGQALAPHLVTCQLHLLGAKIERPGWVARICRERLREFLADRANLNDFYPGSVYHAAELLLKLLDDNPAHRPTAVEALNLQFLCERGQEEDALYFAGTDLNAMRDRGLLYAYYHPRSDLTDDEDESMFGSFSAATYTGSSHEDEDDGCFFRVWH
ncbi:uncharacterized protein VTP21DRAFT_4500 [Calcarisporiella thermophila]|uniref:uncharacterized protein n=1 Tax=Calcarisporiella thermophila TaxID=911321 RepID=UPI00374409F8